VGVVPTLEERNIPCSTAYYWLNKYEESIGEREVKPKTKWVKALEVLEPEQSVTAAPVSVTITDPEVAPAIAPAQAAARQAWNNLSAEEQAQWGNYSQYRLVNWERRHDHGTPAPAAPEPLPELAPILTDKPTLEELSEIIKFIADDIDCGHQLHELSDRLVSIADDIDRIVLLDNRISNADPQRYDRDISTLIKGLVRDRRNEQEMKDALGRGETHYDGKKIMGSRSAPYIQRWTRAECKNRLAEAYNPVEPKPTA